MEKHQKYLYQIYCLTKCQGVILLFFFAITSANAQTALSLTQAIEKGLKNNFDIKKRKVEVQMAANKLANAPKERLPVINTSLNRGNAYINDKSPISFVNGFYEDNNWSMSLDGNWVIFDGFQGRLNKQRYKKLKERSLGQSEMTKEGVIENIMISYYKALLEKEALEVARNTLSLSKARYQDTQLQLSLGEASNYDVLRFKNAWLSDSSTVIIQKKKWKTAILNLNRAMNNQQNITYTITNQFFYRPKNYDKTALGHRLTKKNLTIINQQNEVALAQLNTEAMQKKALPNLTVSSGVNQRFNANNFPEVPKIRSNTFQFYFRFSANYNLFDGGLVRRAVEEQRLEEEIAQLTLSQMKQNLSAHLSIAVENYNQQLAIIYIKEELVANLQESIQLEKERFTNGLSSALNYRTIQLEYTNAQYDLLEAIYELKINEIELLKLTGGLKKEWRYNF